MFVCEGEDSFHRRNDLLRHRVGVGQSFLLRIISTSVFTWSLLGSDRVGVSNYSPWSGSCIVTFVALLTLVKASCCYVVSWPFPFEPATLNSQLPSLTRFNPI